MQIINLTPHAICLNDGQIFEPSGTIARVAVKFSQPEEKNGCSFFKNSYGKVEGLPEEINDNVLYLVSAMVFAATDRKDVICPATGHHECNRNENGQIISVPGFIEK